MNEEDRKEAERLLLKHRADEAWRKRHDVALAWWQGHCQSAREMYVNMTAALDAAYEDGVKEGRRLTTLEFTTPEGAKHD